MLNASSLKWQNNTADSYMRTLSIQMYRWFCLELGRKWILQMKYGTLIGIDELIHKFPEEFLVVKFLKWQESFSLSSRIVFSIKKNIKQNHS